MKIVDTDITPTEAGLLTEVHPWEPFIPDGAVVLMLGTFPPPRKRWSMDFFYPNRTNDFWKVCGLLFYGDERALYDSTGRNFDEQRIRRMLTEKRIAMSDTAREVRRLKGNASDKFLEIVTPIDLRATLARMPDCHTVATTGEKAAGVIAAQTGTQVPPICQPVTTSDGLTLWRMPSTSRAYPMPVAQKAEAYAELFRSVGIQLLDDRIR